MFLHELPPGRKPPSEISVIVEVPKGGRNKYEYDKKLGVIYMDRRLYSAVQYPGDYGFIPSTLADDKGSARCCCADSRTKFLRLSALCTTARHANDDRRKGR